MPPRRFVALAIVIFASVASAQTQERVLYFEPTLTPQGSQEITAHHAIGLRGDAARR